MQLIVGHTTHDSAWIWVRGDRKDRRFKVELETVDSREGNRKKHSKRVEVDAKRDYTAVARFDFLLLPCATYKVTLLSSTLSGKLEGELRTFPRPDCSASFRFLHGSCNLSAPRLTALGSTAVALLGTAATSNALKMPFSEWDVHQLPRWYRLLGRRPLRGLATWLVKKMNFAVAGFTMQTRFEQPKMRLTDSKDPQSLLEGPFDSLVSKLKDENGSNERPAFMIHCGDQIYFDVDFPKRRGKKEDYRHNYRQAWFEDDGTREILRRMPHYMILDDHEILDGFGTDRDEKAKKNSKAALVAYDEYVSARQPGETGKRYYKFEHGDTAFFVLDTRTERRSRSADSRQPPQMISEEQLEELEEWLPCKRPDKGLQAKGRCEKCLKDQERCKDYGLRFIVSSVPFVAQLRPPGLDANGERRPDGRADKWSGEDWREQRERIIASIYKYGVERLVFLVGDMHCTYHATMQIGTPERRITIHELAGGPFNQLQFAERDGFYARYAGEFTPIGAKDDKERLPWVSTLQAFHGAAPSVLDVSVTPQSEHDPPRVDWKALRAQKTEERKPPNLRAPCDPHDLCGSIRFPRHSVGSS